MHRVSQTDSERNMKFLNLLILFVLLFPSIQYVSTSSSCEHLQNILHDLLGSCGGKSYQLDCQENDAIFRIYSNNFLVKDISFENTTFRLVSPFYSPPGDSSCSLPKQTLYWPSLIRDFNSYYIYRIFNFGTQFNSYCIYRIFNFGTCVNYQFLNCTEEIKNRKYELIPCLNRTNSRVYATADLFRVSKLHDSCKLIGSAVADPPLVSIDNATRRVNYAALMHAFETGLLVNWRSIETNHFTSYLSCSNFERCSREAIQFWKGLKIGYKILAVILLLGPDMAMCGYYQDRVTFCLMLILNVLLYLVLIMLVTRIILAPLAVCSFLLHKRWKITSSSSSIELFLRQNEILSIRRYDFVEISIMTNYFKDKIGQGGFGSVYRGKLFSGQQVAVKVLSNSIGNGDDFISEVATIGRIHHANIVRLIGFCSEGSKRALIYAYMPNGSLDKYIFSSNINVLPMEKRREIAIGIARGIDYLHRGCEMQILHFDIKPNNILLDNDLTPKISDFGLARLYSRDHTLMTLSMTRGTIGYIAPELISRTFGAISYKADIYSFGMLLMELASGRRNVNNYTESSSQVYYPSWIYDQLKLPEEAHSLKQSVGKFGEIEETLYKVALWCIQMKASNRPAMSSVIEMLQSVANSLEMPPRPFMVVSRSEIESCNIELSLISEESSML